MLASTKLNQSQLVTTELFATTNTLFAILH